MDANPRRVRCRLGRIAATTLTVVAVLSLCGCGGGSGSSGGGFLSGSRIFGGSTRMTIAPIFGVPKNIEQELTQDLIAAGKDRRLTLSSESKGAPYTLRGYLVASKEKKGSKISYIWDVADAKGERVARVSGDEIIASRSGSDPWSGVDSAALRRIAEKTTSQIAASMPGGSSAPVASSPSAASRAPGVAPSAPAARKAPGKVMALVSPVSGAPGDGKSSLTAALKKRLYAGGVKLASAAAGNVYTVKGKVSLTSASGGRESIRIDWQVIDPKGKRLGTVSQQNTIPKGSLNGPWGPIADAAAGAAADGIIKLLPKSST